MVMVTVCSAIELAQADAQKRTEKSGE